MRKELYTSSLGLGVTIGITVTMLAVLVFMMITAMDVMFLPTDADYYVKYEAISRFVEMFCFFIAITAVLFLHAYVVSYAQKQYGATNNPLEFDGIDYRMIFKSVDPLDALCQWIPVILYVMMTSNIIGSITGAGSIDYALICAIIFIEAVLAVLTFDSTLKSSR